MTDYETKFGRAYVDARQVISHSIGEMLIDGIGENGIRVAGLVGDNWRALLAAVESPIELSLGAYLVHISTPSAIIAIPPNRPFSIDPDATLFLHPQMRIGEYRADFVIEMGWRGAVRRIAVECDGHEFHERTKEQAARDRSRDRWFQSEGIKVFRFTGAEIWRDAEGCASEVLAMLAKEWRELRATNG